jgi:hypothetical protein
MCRDPSFVSFHDALCSSRISARNGGHNTIGIQKADLARFGAHDFLFV